MAADATAFAHRDARFCLKLSSGDPEWVERTWARLAPLSTGGVYPNFAEPQRDPWDSGLPPGQPGAPARGARRLRSNRPMVRTAHTAELDADTLNAAQALLEDVFEGELTAQDWDNCLGGDPRARLRR